MPNSPGTPNGVVDAARMLVDGRWLDEGSDGRSEVRSPYDGALIASVPAGGPTEVDRAVGSAAAAFGRGDFSRPDRIAVLDRAVTALTARHEEFAQLVAAESAKPIRTARTEAARAVDTFAWAAAEARTMAGEQLPLDAVSGGAGKLAFALRVPVGVVAAISPFNFPLNLVAHKLAPAIAAGCPVVLKPATQTPLSALRLAELLIDAGLPPGWLHVVTGGGGTVGEALVRDVRVAYITFTGSAEVGWAIAPKNPKARVRLELGSNSPLVLDADADVERAADKVAVAGFAHAGQSCISTQRIYAHVDCYDAFVAALVPRVARLRVGDPLQETTDVSALISEADRDRVLAWVAEAADAGATVLTGGIVEDGCVRPTVLADVTPDMKVSCEEVFGPVVTVSRVADFDEGLRLANDSTYGLQAGVFTGSVAHALQAARTLRFGGVLVNEVPTFRADLQPYGGVKDSGNTREGPKYAIQEMTELRFVSIEA